MHYKWRENVEIPGVSFLPPYAHFLCYWPCPPLPSLQSLSAPSKAPITMAGKKIKVPLLEIPWSENSHARVWSLIAEISKPANYKVLYGKKDKNEVCFTFYFAFLPFDLPRTPLVSQRQASISALALLSCPNFPSLIPLLLVIMSRVN